jgi:hypothetical protein
LGAPFIAANAVFGVLVVLFALTAARTFGSRLKKSPWMAVIVDALSGKSYREAANLLNTIERYREG